MPIAQADLNGSASSSTALTELPFPPITKSHILHCSYHSWYPRYRSITPKSRVIPLSASFLSYLRSDGIILPPDDIQHPNAVNDAELSDEGKEEEENTDPSVLWPEIHEKIKSTINELGGSVMPKLNWSAPKDATWISATNDMDCRTPNDVYLLLKSSDFVTHDLEQVFDDCESDTESDSASNSEASQKEDEVPEARCVTHSAGSSEIPYCLVLRKKIPAYNPSLEFRCFVRARQLLCMCQRDLNHFSFLPPLVSKFRSLIQQFFDKNLQKKFPDENFVFDVYIPPPHDRVWLIDLNPWAPRTDPLLFSWLAILNMIGSESAYTPTSYPHSSDHAGEGCSEEESDEEDIFVPELRLVNQDDPEAYSFNTPQYSAHKMPKDVVDASVDGGAGLREFMGTWRDIVAKQEQEDRDEVHND